MNKRGWMMFRVLINHYNPAAGNALLKFLSKEEAQKINEQAIDSSDLNPILHQPQKSLAHVHYSWIQPLLSHFPPSMLPTVMAALTAEQVAGIRSPVSLPIVDCIKAFILNKLFSLLDLADHLPVEYLPPSDLSILANWTKPRLVNLIDHLGLYDLASEVRHIVNPHQLKNIYTCLTPKQFHFLKISLHQKEKLTSPKLGIDLSKIEPEKLKQMLHKRGLIRLGRALCGQHADLVWHIAHILDMGRGSLLLKEYRGEEIAKITPILKQQVINIMHFLKNE